MAVVRFQVVSLPRSAADEPPSAKAGDGASADPERLKRRRYTWRFLAANNRCLAMAPTVYPDARSCVAALVELKRGLPRAECRYVRDENGLWRWAVQSGEAAAASSTGYARHVRARLTCANFFALAADPGALQNMQIVYR